jgi:hypothetical protein
LFTASSGFDHAHGFLANSISDLLTQCCKIRTLCGIIAGHELGLLPWLGFIHENLSQKTKRAQPEGAPL